MKKRSSSARTDEKSAKATPRSFDDALEKPRKFAFGIPPGSVPDPETSAAQISSRKTPEIPDRLYFRIGEVSEILDVKPYVLRYWESEFPFLSPVKSSSGQRVYKRGDVETLLLIQHLLYNERYSIEGARMRIRELRREGQKKTYTREKVLGGSERLARKDRLQKVRALAEEIHSLNRRALHDFFKI